MQANRFVDIIIESLAREESDGIFETQFDFVYASINTYSPRSFREEQNDRMFKYILNLIPQINENERNRLIALRGKIAQFAQSEWAKKQLIDWHNGKL